MKSKSNIPKGMYCYDQDGVCPYWSINKDLPEQENGYCSFLDKSDYQRNEELGEIQWQNGKGEITRISIPHEIPMSLIWDQVKECGINDDDDED